MTLTRDFRETIQARARRDATFRGELLREAVEMLLAGEVDTGKAILRDYINATIGFAELGAATHRSSKSLMRMLGPNGNPQAANLFEILAYLQNKEGVHLELRCRRQQGSDTRNHFPPRGAAARTNTAAC